MPTKPTDRDGVGSSPVRANAAPMKRNSGLVAAGLFLACSFQASPAEARGPSTPEERADFVTQVRLLEKDPVGDKANIARQRLREWMLEVPDIRFKVCAELLGNALSGDYPYSRELNLQVMFSGAVLTIEHPGEARNDVAVYTAGVEGALRAYEVLRESRPDGQRAALDDLVEKRRRGELVDHIAMLVKEKCKRTNAGLIAAPIGAAAGLVIALILSHWFGGRAHSRAAVPGGVTPTVGGTKLVAVSRRIVLVCAAYYTIVGIALHFLEPEYDPRYLPMSHYAWGAHGWLMTTTFFVLGLAIFTVAVALRNYSQSSQTARIGFGLLVVGALFVCLAGVFRSFPLHDVASAVALPSIAMAVLVLSWSLRKALGGQAKGAAVSVIAVVMLVALLSIILDVGMPGLQQRVFLFLLLVWLSIIVDRMARMAAGLDQPRVDVRPERAT